MLKFLVLLCLLIFVFSPPAIAQETDENKKEKQERQNLLIEQILADVQNLKLAENRAFVYAKIGGIVWKNDEKHARTLFQDSINELINAQILAESDKKNTAYHTNFLPDSQFAHRFCK